jgi:DNA-binding PadR family transcriptional regulator
MKFPAPKYCDMRGMLSFLILYLLSKREMYGQEIAEEIAKRKGEKPNPGTLYPALKSLEVKGLVISSHTDQTRIYRLTDLGQIELKKACEYFYQVFGDIVEDYQCTRDIVYEI